VSQGFKRVENWSAQGFGDVEVGARYQYLKSEEWALAFTGGIRAPTAKVDDPDDFTDNTLGYGGTYALLFRLHQDYLHQPAGPTKQLGIPEPGSFLVNTTLRYDLFIADKELLRVCNVHAPICPDKENVSRDIGDIVEAELSGNFGLLKGLYFSPLYKFGHKFKDHYSGSQGFDYASLAEETDYNEHVYKIGLSYTTLPLFLEKRFPLPLTTTVFYKQRFAGDNNLFKSKYAGFVIQAFL
jgi:hypothetical protein